MQYKYFGHRKSYIVKKIGYCDRKMGKISVSIPDELEKEIRIKAMKKFGMKKGYLSKAVMEALRLWLKQPKASVQGNI